MLFCYSFCFRECYDLPGFLDYWIIINLTRLYEYICSEKYVFVSTFLPFCPLSFWSQLVYGCGRVETRFYLFQTLNPDTTRERNTYTMMILKKQYRIAFVRRTFQWFTWISGLLDYYELDETMRPNHWDGGSMLSYQLQSILWSVNATAAVTGA